MLILDCLLRCNYYHNMHDYIEFGRNGSLSKLHFPISWPPVVVARIATIGSSNCGYSLAQIIGTTSVMILKAVGPNLQAKSRRKVFFYWCMKCRSGGASLLK